MLNKYKQKFKNLFSTNFNDKKIISNEIIQNRLLIGRKLSFYLKQKGILNDIQEAEFKVFSQWGDDGIIQYLINNVKIENDFFIEFGVEDYTEANTRFLLHNDNWSGLILDSSSKNIESIKNSSYYWKYDIQATKEFVTAENINDLLIQNEVPDRIGLLHIDIDGNDYWVWKAIECVTPDIVIVEYNSVFGSERSITVPYKSDFNRTKAHYSNLYFGASLLALCDLAREKGYLFVGSNSAGNNAYFVKKEKLENIKELTPEEGYEYSKFRESRAKSGELNYLRGEERLDVIKGLPVYNVRENRIEEF